MNKFRHKAIYGMTSTGKTWFLKRQAKILRKYQQKVLVFTASGDIAFPAGCTIITDPDDLEMALANTDNWRSHVMLDEGAVLFDETKKSTHPEIWNLFNMGRHKGYTGYIATQYPTSIPKRVRVNCGECYSFRLGDFDSAQLVWKDYNRLSIDKKPAWEVIQGLPDCKALYFRQPEIIEKVSLI